ncbi:hypothetical protein BD779DRAFT_649015 [Infundibulicybe gibba]|nr:hypothetical protein BD779DRAFT_649015 [Infundibulicybe gibba]
MYIFDPEPRAFIHLQADSSLTTLEDAFTYLDAQALGTIFECIFYGAYVVLFILYLVLQCRNNRVVDAGPLTLAQILLFGLCTTSFCLDIPAAYFIVVCPTSSVGLGSQHIFRYRVQKTSR